MTSEELANGVTECVLSLQERILGVGALEYDPQQTETQPIETKDIEELILDALQEIDDMIVYAAVLRMRISNLSATIEIAARI
jgi:transcriptional regulator NrdR family protein